MEVTKNLNDFINTKMDKLVKTTLFLIMMLAAVLFAMALIGCSNDEPGQEPDSNLPQETGSIMGSVKDENGGLYPGVRVVVSKGSEEVARTTNTDGTYTVNTKDIGMYSIEIIPPLATEVVTTNPTSVNILASQPSAVDFEIQSQPVEALLNFGDVQLLEEIKDKDGNTPTAANEPLYAANIFDEPLGLLTAIKAPDGHHVTLSEFKTAKGNLIVHCDGDIATVEITLEGLIPNGTYTFWLAYLNKTKRAGEPIDFMNDFVNPTNPPIGSSSGTENIATAEADGTINVTLEHTSCILTDEVALVIPILYHINGKTFGGGHVPDPEEVVQLLAYFQ